MCECGASVDAFAVNSLYSFINSVDNSVGVVVVSVTLAADRLVRVNRSLS